jgi:hypothetical protein
MAAILDRLKAALYAPVEDNDGSSWRSAGEASHHGHFLAVSPGYRCAAAKHKEVAVE